MVKLQRHKAYTYKSDSGKAIEHYKYLINIPESALGKLGWNEGQELNFSIHDNVLTLEPSKPKTYQQKR